MKLFLKLGFYLGLSFWSPHLLAGGSVVGGGGYAVQETRSVLSGIPFFSFYSLTPLYSKSFELADSVEIAKLFETEMNGIFSVTEFLWRSLAWIGSEAEQEEALVAAMNDFQRSLGSQLQQIKKEKLDFIPVDKLSQLPKEVAPKSKGATWSFWTGTTNKKTVSLAFQDRKTGKVEYLRDYLYKFSPQSRALFKLHEAHVYSDFYNQAPGKSHEVVARAVFSGRMAYLKKLLSKDKNKIEAFAVALSFRERPKLSQECNLEDNNKTYRFTELLKCANESPKEYFFRLENRDLYSGKMSAHSGYYYAYSRSRVLLNSLSNFFKTCSQASSLPNLDRVDVQEEQRRVFNRLKMNQITGFERWSNSPSFTEMAEEWLSKPCP